MYLIKRFLTKLPVTFLLQFIHNCHFLSSLFLFSAGLTEQIKLDRYLHPHFRYYMREIRTVVYSQFLESYKSVTIEAMAKAFGVTVDFIDVYVNCLLCWLLWGLLCAFLILILEFEVRHFLGILCAFYINLTHSMNLQGAVSFHCSREAPLQDWQSFWCSRN